jgi:hypothetical protein
MNLAMLDRFVRAQQAKTRVFVGQRSNLTQREANCFKISFPNFCVSPKNF